MIEIKTDLAKVLSQVEATEKQIQKAIPRIVRDVATQARDAWVKLAGESIHNPDTRDLYIKGMRPKRPGQYSAQTALGGIQPPHKVADEVQIIALKGTAPNMLESGYDPFNIEKAILSSTGKEYVDIPFKHLTPGGGKDAKRRNPNDPRSVMPRSVHSHMQKQLEKATKLGRREARGQSLPGRARSHHATNIFSNMRAPVGAGSQTQYHTFRRISRKRRAEREEEQRRKFKKTGKFEPIENWQAPGFDGFHLAPKVKEIIDNTAPQLVAKRFEGMFSEGTKK